MAEYTSRRRQEMGADEFDKEMQEAERAAAKGEEIERKKREKRERLEQDPVYKACAQISKVMDRYFLDPIIGFFAPGVGDFLSTFLALPFAYVSLVKIKSIPLTLAIIFNTLVDMLVGAVPVLGDLFDVFHRSHKKNYGLLTGFIEDNEEVKKEVNKKALFCGIGIGILLVLLYFMLKFAGMVVGYIWDQFTALFS